MKAQLCRIALAAAALCAALLAAAPARALDIRCIEASRYRDLLQVFNDDAGAFYQYFGLERSKPLDPNACRAAVVSGQIAPGDADRLLAEISRNRGWLALLYVAFTGSDPKEEALLAHVVRTFWLRTYAARSPTIRYAPDFAAIAATPVDAQADMERPRSEGGPLDTGLRAYLRRGDLAIALNAPAPDCVDACASVWAGGVNRRTWFLLSLLNKPAPPPPPAGRMALINWLDGEGSNRGVDGRRAQVSPAPATIMPPAAVNLVEEQCAIEVSAINSLSRRIGAAVNDASGREFSVAALQMGVLNPQFDALRNAGARIQQCISGALERKRVATFTSLCGAVCDLPKLRDQAEAAATEFLARTPKP